MKFFRLIISLLTLITCFCAPLVSATAPAPTIQPPPHNSAPQTALARAIADPEYMLDHWVALDTASTSAAPAPTSVQKTKHLSLREAILLALRYNPNIQNAELDRIIQRYQLRLAHNAFELQYALAGSAAVMQSRYSGVGTARDYYYFMMPELGLKTQTGATMSLQMANTLNYNNNNYNNYLPELKFTFTQPLLRGFGKNVNNSAWLNALDNETMNKINLQQAVMDQITAVIFAYRALIMSSNNLQNQQHQLEDAQQLLQINAKKIAAGQLEPTANIQSSYQVESLSLMVEQAGNDFKVAAQNLLQLIGLEPNIKLAVPDNVNVPKLMLPDLNTSIQIAWSHNAQYLQQQMLLRADERAYKIAKNQQLWQLDFGANVTAGKINEVAGSRSVRGIYNGQNTNETASLTLSVPLHDLNRRAELINAKVRLEKDRLNLLALKRALITNITNMISTIQSQAKRYQLAEKQLRLALRAYNLEKQKQQAGISSALDVNNTQNQLILSQAGLIGAKIAYLNEISALERLLGTTLDTWQIKLAYGAGR